MGHSEVLTTPSFQETNTRSPTTTMSFFGETVPQNLKTGGVYSHFSFNGHDARTGPGCYQHAPKKSSRGELSIYTEGGRKKSNISLFKLELKARHEPMQSQVCIDLLKTASYSTYPQSPRARLVFASVSPTNETFRWPVTLFAHLDIASNLTDGAIDYENYWNGNAPSNCKWTASCF